MWIFLLLFCTVLIIIVFVYTPTKYKEHFSTTDNLTTLQTDFASYTAQAAPETCNLLAAQSFDIDKKNIEIQNTYLSANRIRKLKKENSITNNSCYIDNDPKNGIQDYVMKNSTCDKTNAIFKNVPFITDVYSDDKKDRSRNFPVNKCVFDVDPTKINTNSLNAFWNNMQDVECLQQSMALSNDIQSYIDQLFQCHGNLYLQDDMLKVLKAQVNDRNTVTQELENVKYDLTQTIQNLLANIQELADDTTRINTQIEQIQSSLKTCLDDKSKNKNDWIDKHTTLKTKYSTLLERLAMLKKQFDKLTEDLKICHKQLDKVNKQIGIWQKEHNLMQPAFQIIVKNLKVAEDQLAQIKKDLAACNIKKNACEKELFKVNATIDDLQNKYNKCKTDLNVCVPDQKICQVAEDDIHIKDVICSSDLDDCLRSVKALEVMKKEQQNEIDYLKSLLKTCDSVKDQNNQLMATIQTLTLKQQLTTNDINTVVDQINKTKQIVNDAVASAISTATPNFCANATAAADNAILKGKIAAAATAKQPGTSYKEWISLNGPFNIDHHNLGGAYHYDSVQDCQNACKSNANCTHLVFNTTDNTCQLKGPPSKDSKIHCGDAKGKFDDPTYVSFINLQRWGFNSMPDCDYYSGHQKHCDQMFEGEVTKW